MKYTIVLALILMMAPVAASQNGYFEAQRLESARQDKAKKPPPPMPKPAEGPQKPK